MGGALQCHPDWRVALGRLGCQAVVFGEKSRVVGSQMLGIDRKRLDSP
jgi:hypothetical protein